MSESSTWEVPWSIMSQVRLEIESDLRASIAQDIDKYSRLCQERGLSTYFTSGLDVAASIAITGIPQPQGQMEELPNE